jgi:histone-lysine N-methyltransferase SETMAR
VSWWASRFRKGWISIQDDPKSGRPVTATDDTSVVIVSTLLEEDRRKSCEEIAHEANMSTASVFRIVTQTLQNRKVAAKWVPHQLSEEQKAAHKRVAEELQQRYEAEGEQFLNRVVAIDFEPQLKSQSCQWKHTTSPRPKKCHRQQAKVKFMMIIAYDKNGVIATYRVPPGSTVTVAYYRKFLQDILCPKIRQKKYAMFASGVLILHDNAWLHASGAVSEILEKYGWQVLPHPLYSPDMSPPDFDLFPILKKPLRAKRFRSNEEVSNEVTRVIRRINNEGVLTGIQDLPKRWTAVTKHNGDYIEGL